MFWVKLPSSLCQQTIIIFALRRRLISLIMFRYQAGENIYNLFDKVLVIDQGRTVYFGPAQDAREYFVSLGFKDMPRQSTADYLTACTDPNERQVAAGVKSDTVPSTPQAFEAAFRASPHYRQMESERAEYEKKMEVEKVDQEQFRLAVLESKKKGVSKKSPYTLGFWGQVQALTKRQFRLQLQDKFTLWTSFWISTVSVFELPWKQDTNLFVNLNRFWLLFWAPHSTISHQQPQVALREEVSWCVLLH